MVACAGSGAAAAAAAACIAQCWLPLALHNDGGQQPFLPIHCLASVHPCPPPTSRLGNLNWRLAAGLAVGSVVGGAVGSQAAVHAPPYSLEAVFMVTLLALARMTLKSVR